MSVEPLDQNSSVHEALKVAGAFVPLCSLKPNYLQDLFRHARVDQVHAGHVLIDRGSYDRRHIYLVSGRVQMIFASGYCETIQAKDQLHALANELPRPCKVVADTDCIVLTIDSDQLDRTLSWSQISEYVLSELSAERYLDEDLAWSKKVLNSNLFFKVPPVNAERILTRMELQPVKAGEAIVRQDEIGNGCYFIKEGAARVTRHDNNEHVVLADIGVGRCFGEDALVYETLRNATVTMLTDGTLMYLAKDDFKPLLVEPEIDEVEEGQLEGLPESPVFIDVRTEAEYDEGHLVMAVNLPLNLLSRKKQLLCPDVSYVLYCDTGRRSRAAAFLLGKAGFKAAALRGGLVGAGMQYQLVADSGHILKNGQLMKG